MAAVEMTGFVTVSHRPFSKMGKKDEENKCEYESFSCNMRAGMQGHEPRLLAPLLPLEANAKAANENVSIIVLHW